MLKDIQLRYDILPSSGYGWGFIHNLAKKDKGKQKKRKKNRQREQDVKEKLIITIYKTNQIKKEFL